MAGRARTLRYVPLREDLLPYLREAGMENPQREAIEAVQPGDVFVVDAMGSLEAATMGDILASRIKKRGAAGIVADGCVRDSRELGGIEVGVLALATNPLRSKKEGTGRRDVPVSFGGVTWTPGQYVYADDDGVVVASEMLHAAT